MKKILLMLLIPIIFSCSESKKIVKNGRKFLKKSDNIQGYLEVSNKLDTINLSDLLKSKIDSIESKLDSLREIQKSDNKVEKELVITKKGILFAVQVGAYLNPNSQLTDFKTTIDSAGITHYLVNKTFLTYSDAVPTRDSLKMQFSDVFISAYEGNNRLAITDSMITSQSNFTVDSSYIEKKIENIQLKKDISIQKSRLDSLNNALDILIADKKDSIAYFNVKFDYLKQGVFDSTTVKYEPKLKLYSK